MDRDYPGSDFYTPGKSVDIPFTVRTPQDAEAAAIIARFWSARVRKMKTQTAPIF